MWFAEDPERLVHERQEMASLQSDSPWLTCVDWTYDTEAKKLRVDADLAIGDQVRKISVMYPHIFPSTPPSVVPRETTERWSFHQYGAGGELCLAYRADNWLTSYTAADMVRSAYELLSAEDTIGPEGGRLEVPSAHKTTVGQNLRSKFRRYILTAQTKQRLQTLVGVEPADFTVWFSETRLAYCLSSMGTGDAIWKDALLPAPLQSAGIRRSGFVIALPDDDTAGLLATFGPLKSAKELRATLLGDVGGDFLVDEVLLVQTSAGCRVIALSVDSDATDTIEVIEPTGGNRLPPEYKQLAGKKVAVLGCGSVGSKVASMLARAGVCSFLLVDDDVFLPENLIRNELDWRDIGFHKVEAVSQKIRLINSEACVDVRRQQLGGQESSGLLDGTIQAVSSCDLIIDATASDIAFNYAAAVVVKHKMPMVWGAVYAGGIGGQIARSRPTLDPSPQLARAKINGWWGEQFAESPQKNVVDYGLTNSAGEVMVADDSDVSVIAAHLARLAIDTLVRPHKSQFNHSAYMIGLREGLIFAGTFDTIPIDLGPPEVEHEATPLSDEIRGKVLTCLNEDFGGKDGNP